MRCVHFALVAGLLVACTDLKDPDSVPGRDAATDAAVDAASVDGGGPACAIGTPLQIADPGQLEEIFAAAGYSMPTEMYLLPESPIITWPSTMFPSEISLALGANEGVVVGVEDDTGLGIVQIEFDPHDPSSATYNLETSAYPNVESIAVAGDPMNDREFISIGLVDDMVGLRVRLRPGLSSMVQAGFAPASMARSLLGGVAISGGSGTTSFAWFEGDTAAGTSTYIRGTADFTTYDEDEIATTIQRQSISATPGPDFLLGQGDITRLWSALPSRGFTNVGVNDVPDSRASAVGYRVDGGRTAAYHVFIPNNASGLLRANISCPNTGACTSDSTIAPVVGAPRAGFTAATSFLTNTLGFAVIAISTADGGATDYPQVLGPAVDESSGPAFVMPADSFDGPGLPAPEDLHDRAAHFEDVQIATTGTPEDFVIIVALTARALGTDNLWIGGVRFCGATAF